MAKTKEELNALKEEIETLSKKLAELTDEELEQVVGGVIPHAPGVGSPFNVIQEREELLGYGWQDKATP